MPEKVLICGCGGQGRSIIKSLLENPNVEIALITDSHEATTLAKLLELETGYKVDADKNNIVINDLKIPVLKDESFNVHLFEELGIDIVIKTHVNKPMSTIDVYSLADAKKVVISTNPLHNFDLLNIVDNDKESFVTNDIYNKGDDYKTQVKLLNQKYHNSKYLLNRRKGHK